MVHAQRELQLYVKSVPGEHGVQMELLIAASAQVSQMKHTAYWSNKSNEWYPGVTD